jgi:hypothetical protein
MADLAMPAAAALCDLPHTGLATAAASAATGTADIMQVTHECWATHAASVLLLLQLLLALLILQVLQVIT